MLHNLFNEYHACTKQKGFLFLGSVSRNSIPKIWVGANFVEKLCGSTILEKMSCAQGSDVFAMKLRYSLGKLIYKLKNITILERNNNGKRKIQIMKMM